jgi:translation initiation factor 6 (eIF-6)
MIMGIVFNDGILFHPKTREDIIKTIGEIANLAF